MLQLKQISKSYTTGAFTQIALDNVSLNFRRNEFVAILGPSGSGKTTCLNMIGGLDQYDSGDLIINGKLTKDFRDSDWDAYRNNSVGFVFQSYNLIAHLSILDNVEMGMTLSGVPAKAKRRKATEVLEQVGLKDHMHKKPNQLSGGQMQRVAIARALANDPDIILADEPTGALDTETSKQILELIKEIAEDKLVVMVTHNSQLANTYADRIVQFLDGKVIADSNPYGDHESSDDYELKQTSMSFWTALKISGKNIATKKWRTALTAFASSIGIIGIALILSLSNGFDKQIGNFQAETLSGFPIMLTESAASVDMADLSEQRAGARKKRKDTSNLFPDAPVIYPYDAAENTIMHSNVLSPEYVDYVEAIDQELLAGIAYSRLVNMNMLKSDGETATRINASALNFSSYPSTLGDNPESYLQTNYELLAGSYPQKMTDLVLLVDKRNRLDTSILKALGLDYEATSLPFDDLLDYELKIILNDTYYKQVGDYFMIDGSADNLIEMYNSENTIPLRISGIVRAKEESLISLLSAGVAHSDQLAQFFIQDAQDSAIVKAQRAADYNVLTGASFAEKTTTHSGMGPPMMGAGNIGGAGTLTKEKLLSSLGADGTPMMINLYPTDFTAKELVLDYLDDWNEGLDPEDYVIYTDMAATVTDLTGGIMDAITLVLIAFAAISLVVSLIMIGIITYISVLERTKEIGVLRALGARKKDITRVFNAETFIIGTCSGLLGITIAYLLTIPTNVILERATDLSNVAQLDPLHALLLIAVSVTLTLLGGFIPAKMAANKDPVAALRAE